MLVVPKAPIHVKSSLLSVLKSKYRRPLLENVNEKSEVSNALLYIIILSVVSQFHWQMLKKVTRCQEKITTHQSS